MIFVSKLQNWLPSRQAVSFTLQFKKDFSPGEEVLRSLALERGYEVVAGSIAIAFRDDKTEWSFVAIAGKRNQAQIADLARELAAFEGIESFQLSHARN